MVAPRIAPPTGLAFGGDVLHATADSFLPLRMVLQRSMPAADFIVVVVVVSGGGGDLGGDDLTSSNGGDRAAFFTASPSRSTASRGATEPRSDLGPSRSLAIRASMLNEQERFVAVEIIVVVFFVASNIFIALSNRLDRYSLSCRRQQTFAVLTVHAGLYRPKRKHAVIIAYICFLQFQIIRTRRRRTGNLR